MVFKSVFLNRRVSTHQRVVEDSLRVVELFPKYKKSCLNGHLTGYFV